MQMGSARATGRAYVTDFKTATYIVTNAEFNVVITQMSIVSAVVAWVLDNNEVAKCPVEAEVSNFAVSNTKDWGSGRGRIINAHMGTPALYGRWGLTRLFGGRSSSAGPYATDPPRYAAIAEWIGPERTLN